MSSDIYIDTKFLQKNNFGYSITIDFVGIDHITPHLKYEKLSKLKKECIGLKFAFHFLN